MMADELMTDALTAMATLPSFGELSRLAALYGYKLEETTRGCYILRRGTSSWHFTDLATGYALLTR